MAVVSGIVYCGTLALQSIWKKLQKKKHDSFQITGKVLHSVLKKF